MPHYRGVPGSNTWNCRTYTEHVHRTMCNVIHRQMKRYMPETFRTRALEASMHISCFHAPMAWAGTQCATLLT